MHALWRRRRRNMRNRQCAKVMTWSRKKVHLVIQTMLLQQHVPYVWKGLVRFEENEPLTVNHVQRQLTHKAIFQKDQKVIMRMRLYLAYARTCIIGNAL